VRDSTFYVSSLLELSTASPADRRVLWRQALVALSRSNPDGGPGPLEGIHAEVLQRAVSTALQSGLVDDLDWLSPSAAGVALFTLAAALPVGNEQRELGRRVLARMLAGTAETFTTIVTSMAQSTGRGLSTPNVRARIALVTELPLVHGIADGPLALALVSRRQFQRDWVSVPSTRSLPSRRLVAKILERAAREATRRAQMGDAHALRVLRGEAVKTAFDRLLADREPLVWRYVAVARGLAAGWVPELQQEIIDGLADGLSPTEWRRAAASLAAFGAVRPEEALKLTASAVKRGLFSRTDPATAAAFVWGIPRTIEAEPEIAARMLEGVLQVPLPEVVEAVSELRYEYGPSKVVDRVTRQVAQLLESTEAERRASKDARASSSNDLVHVVARELDSDAASVYPIRAKVASALDAFASEGAPVAYQRARDALVSAKASVDELESNPTGSLVLLRDIDAGLLERPSAAELLKLGTGPEARSSEAAFDALRERITEAILMAEAPAGMTEPHGESSSVTLRLRRLRALLHLIDGDFGDVSETSGKGSSEALDADRVRRLRALWLRAVRALLEHFVDEPPSALRRTLLAALARAFDALVRLGVCEATDALLVLSMRIRALRDVETLAEASMDPDLRQGLARYARYLRDSEPSPDEPRLGNSTKPPRDAADARLRALGDWAEDVAAEGSSRSEALRNVLLRLHDALEVTSKVTALSALSTSGSSDPDVLGAVEIWVSALSHMCAGASSRIEPERSAASVMPPSRHVGVLVTRVLSESGLGLDSEEFAKAIEEMIAPIPNGIGRVVGNTLARLIDLPVERPSAELGALSVGEQLPAWLPARRTIGGFYVHRALGVGGTASVFVVSRVEDKQEEDAEKFALKIPDYNATAARSLSQDEFLKLFREEASALIMLPSHANLARFVTFDMGTKPLPILVMELVEGVTLERVLQAQTLDVKRALEVLDDVLGGLEAMHSVGIGHLDLKPSNVVLRGGEQGVLVDFGLAGRKIRQGCATGPYGAPEVWGLETPGHTPTPPAADIYSFGCLAYEVLTGTVLFDAPTEVAQVTMHLSHDGCPEGLKRWMQNPTISPLAELLMGTLRQDPRLRPSAESLRAELRAIGRFVESARWPVAAPV
jgi:hypothetical protein